VTPRGIKPIRRATGVHLELRDDELAAMPDPSRNDALLAIEEALELFAAAAALPSERGES
jgi:hypothetical protein